MSTQQELDKEAGKTVCAHGGNPFTCIICNTRSTPAPSVEGGAKINRIAVGTKAVIAFFNDPNIPEDEVHLRLDGKTVGVIKGVTA